MFLVQHLLSVWIKVVAALVDVTQNTGQISSLIEDVCRFALCHQAALAEHPSSLCLQEEILFHRFCSFLPRQGARAPFGRFSFFSLCSCGTPCLSSAICPGQACQRTVGAKWQMDGFQDNEGQSISNAVAEGPAGSGTRTRLLEVKTRYGGGLFNQKP